MKVHTNILLQQGQLVYYSLPQEVEGKYLVQAQSGQGVYTVAIVSKECLQRPNCVPSCNLSRCNFLCRHQITCTCLDYMEGHLCKHCHKIKAMDRNLDVCDMSHDYPPLNDYSFAPIPHSSERAGIFMCT